MKAIQLARLSLSELQQYAGTNWYGDLSTPPFEDVDALDIDDALLKKVHALYTAAYRNETDKGRPLLISDPEGLLKYDVWVLLFANTDDNDPVAFMLASTTACGIKGGLLGTDGDQQSKRAILTLKTAVLQQSRVYAEVSDDLETRLKGRVPTVPFEMANKVLTTLGKTDAVPEPGSEHYTRKIGNLGRVRKLMVGKPILSEP
jgi:hypothetical protein